MARIMTTNILALTFFILTSCSSIITKTPTETWIDVRTPTEYQQSSITGHANIPHTEIANRIAVLVTDKDAPVYLYCGSGRRAGLAKIELEKMGFTNVTNAGGIAEVREKLSTEK
jgi:phage shock operon rhodanese PspE